MNTKPLAYIAVILSGLSMLYKIFLHYRLLNENNEQQIKSFAIAYLMFFLPVLKQGKDHQEKRIIRKANLALLGFFLGIVACAILANLAFEQAGK